jgi:hypothetical protein
VTSDVGLKGLILDWQSFCAGRFVAKITEGLSNLEMLSLNSAELTGESLRLLSERCKKLKSLSIASDHFTAEGLKQNGSHDAWRYAASLSDG